MQTAIGFLLPRSSHRAWPRDCWNVRGCLRFCPWSAPTQQVTLVEAAASFGKTPIGVAWAERLRATAGRVARLGLDRADDVPTRLLYYVAHALQRACDGLGASVIGMVAEISLLPIETATSALINQLAELDDDVFLFRDDY